MLTSAIADVACRFAGAGDRLDLGEKPYWGRFAVSAANGPWRAQYEVVRMIAC